MSAADKAAARRLLAEAERYGEIIWTGEWRDGEKVYAFTPVGQERARQRREGAATARRTSHELAHRQSGTWL